MLKILFEFKFFLDKKELESAFFSIKLLPYYPLERGYDAKDLFVSV